jgi:hypothetical protein
MSRAHADQRRRWPVWAARCLWGLGVAVVLIHLIPGQGYRTATSEGGLSQLFVTAAVMVFLLAFATVGVLVASRVPGNPIGWLLLGSALAYTLAAAATGLAAPGTGGPSGYVAAADLAGQPLYLAGLVLGFLTLLLFPTGSLLSRRWRWAGWLLGMGWLLSTIGQTFGPARLPDFDAANPAAVAGPVGRALGTLQAAGQVVAIAGGVLACVSLIVRFRRADSTVRKQIEWLAYAAIVVLAGVLASIPLQAARQTATITNYQNGIITLALAFVPIAMGIAILTRRLYDIDVIVNKTLVYGSLAVFITAVYVALVVGIGQYVGQRGARGSGCRSWPPPWSRWPSSRCASAFSIWRTAWCTASGPPPTRPCPRSLTSSAPPCRPTSCCRTWPGCSRRRPGLPGRRSGCAPATASGWRPPTRRVTPMMPNETAW